MWIPINTNGKVECGNRNPNISLTRRKNPGKIIMISRVPDFVVTIEHEMLQPQRVSTLNVLANSHQRIMMNNSYHYMHIWLVGEL